MKKKKKKYVQPFPASNSGRISTTYVLDMVHPCEWLRERERERERERDVRDRQKKRDTYTILYKTTMVNIKNRN